MIGGDTPPSPPDIRVSAPASSANLGPGFDSLALALEMRNTIDLWRQSSGEPRIIAVEGEGARDLARDPSNMVLRAMRTLADQAGRVLPPFVLRLCNEVPLGRGLGSSAAAIAGGLVAAAALLDLPGDPQSLLSAALSLEDHPDNVAAALWGGFTVGVLDRGRPCIVHLQPPPELSAVVLIPSGFSSTLESRQTLPERIPRADAIFNGGRCALLALALSQGRWGLLGVAMQDRLHQPWRTAGFPYLEEAIAAAIEAGAHGAALSGAGSSVIALSTDHQGAIAKALADVAGRHGIAARTAHLRVALRGAYRVAPA
ncbi:MAG: homoserine kinase [Chloroflexota bacterium]